MKMKKLTALLLATLMVLTLAACGAKGDSKTENSGDTAQTEEAAATHKSLMDRENEILSENTELWEKVFLAADKGMAMIEDGKNYGDFLLDTIESAKDQFSDEEYALLKKSAQEISEIENKLTELEKQHPEILNEETDANGDVQKFPSFEGKDLDGNEVKSDELFSANAVTVVNFWFTTCSPCVGELGDLDALNKELAEKGGDVYAYMDALAEAEPAGSEGLCFLPYPGGESTPHVDPNARGVFFGLSYRHNLGAMCRSVMEGVTFSLRDILEIIHETNNLTVTEVRAMGGGAKSALWRQIQADVYNASVITMNMDEGPAAGAAILAAVAAGEFPSVEEGCRHILKPVTQTQPIAENVGVYDDFYGTYRKLYPALKPLYQEQAQKVAKYLE